MVGNPGDLIKKSGASLLLANIIGMDRKNLNFYFSRMIGDEENYDNPTSGKYEISQERKGTQLFASLQAVYFFLIGRPDQ